MKHARPDYSSIQDPTGRIPVDEPVFLLRAKDKTAPGVVDIWATLAEQMGAGPEIVAMARSHAEAMRAWQSKHGAKTPDLPPADESPVPGLTIAVRASGAMAVGLEAIIRGASEMPPLPEGPSRLELEASCFDGPRMSPEEERGTCIALCAIADTIGGLRDGIRIVVRAPEAR